MFKRSVGVAMMAFLIQAMSGGPVAARTNPEKEAKLVTKVKTGIWKLGVGKEALVALKLRDKTTVAGYVSEITDDSFNVTDIKTGATTTVAYANVAQVKGNHLSTGAKIAIGAGIAAAIVLILILRAYCNNEGGC